MQAPDTTDGETSEPEQASSGRATLTIADGTVYEFVMSSCDTQDTDPSGFPLSNGYDLSGRTADGQFGMSMGRAGLTDDEPVMSGLVEGDFDDQGKNAKMIYSVPSDTVDLTASGRQVNGTLDLRAIGPTRTHGDRSSATLEANC
ncbi:hypothetical protein C6I20_05290 [Aeromicrobium sp. A1-2]|nr:hypothetical protein C6I20_05290 [Aeromicrobium sp. A1-2]